MARKYPYQTLFLGLAVLIGLVFWHQANGWVYVESVPEPILKFELPLWFQVLASAAVGAVGAGLVVWIVAEMTCLVQWFLRLGMSSDDHDRSGGST